MKKSILAFALFGILVIAGCAGAEPSSSETVEPEIPDTSIAPPTDVDADEMNDSDENEITDERLIVSDAAMYRGTVISITDEGDTRTIVLEQPVGIDFGTPTITFIIDDETRTSFEDTVLEEGAFLEVFYGVNWEGTPDYTQHFNAIAINAYMEAAATNYNGEIVEIYQDSSAENTGSLTMKDLITEDIIIFNYGTEANMYLNIDELKVGDKLNIFHTGAIAMSLPAQGYIMEARYFYDVDAPSDATFDLTSTDSETSSSSQSPTGAKP